MVTLGTGTAVGATLGDSASSVGVMLVGEVTAAKMSASWKRAARWVRLRSGSGEASVG